MCSRHHLYRCWCLHRWIWYNSVKYYLTPSRRYYLITTFFVNFWRNYVANTGAVPREGTKTQCQSFSIVQTKSFELREKLQAGWKWGRTNNFCIPIPCIYFFGPYFQNAWERYILNQMDILKTIFIYMQWLVILISFRTTVTWPSGTSNRVSQAWLFLCHRLELPSCLW